MKSFLTLVLISGLGVFTIGCDSQKGTTENKTVTTTTQSKDGKIVTETTTNDTKTTTTPSAPGGTAGSTPTNAAPTSPPPPHPTPDQPAGNGLQEKNP